MRKLLIIDLQKQFKDIDGNYEKCLEFIEENRKNYDSLYATVFSQIVGNNKNTNFLEKLDYKECENCSGKDLEFNISDINVILKNGYGIRNIEQYFSKDDEVYIIGCEIDACVMAICFQLFDLNINFFVLSDYVYTTSKFFTKEDVLNLYIRNFRKCVI